MKTLAERVTDLERRERERERERREIWLKVRQGLLMIARYIGGRHCDE